jgi:Domain of unknown function (DUF3127)
MQVRCASPALAAMLRAMGIQISGRLHAIFETKQVTDRFQKREFVLELSDKSQYPQFVLFQLTGDRVGAVDAFSAGDQVRVDFSLRGREWTSKQGEVKYFNSLDVWSVEAEGSATGGSSGGGGRSKARDNEPPVSSHEPVFDDDIPF